MPYGCAFFRAPPKWILVFLLVSLLKPTQKRHEASAKREPGRKGRASPGRGPRKHRTTPIWVCLTNFGTPQMVVFPFAPLEKRTTSGIASQKTRIMRIHFYMQGVFSRLFPWRKQNKKSKSTSTADPPPPPPSPYLRHEARGIAADPRPEGGHLAAVAPSGAAVAPSRRARLAPFPGHLGHKKGGHGKSESWFSAILTLK